MQQEQNHAAPALQKIYRPHWRAILLRATLAAIVFELLLQLIDFIPALRGSDSFRSLSNIAIGGMVYAFFIGIFVHTGTSLTINWDGIVFRSQERATLYASWNDIAGIGQRPPQWLFYGRDGLYLHHGYWEPRWFEVKRAERGPKIPFIPLALFDPQWQDHEIGHTLRLHAPWLFDGSTPNASLLTPNAA